MFGYLLKMLPITFLLSQKKYCCCVRLTRFIGSFADCGLLLFTANIVTNYWTTFPLIFSLSDVRKKEKSSSIKILLSYLRSTGGVATDTVCGSLRALLGRQVMAFGFPGSVVGTSSSCFTMTNYKLKECTPALYIVNKVRCKCVQ